MGKFEVSKWCLAEKGAPSYEKIFEGTKKACKNYKAVLDDNLKEKYRQVLANEITSIYFCSETEILTITIDERIN